MEGSQTYRGYTVTNAYLDYVEPDENGQLHRLEVTFDQAEPGRAPQLIGAVWQHIQACDFQIFSTIQKTSKAAKSFRQTCWTTPAA